jgi:hypothetical protein
MSAQLQDNLCKVEIDHELYHDDVSDHEIDYEEIDWDEFARLDMIDDLSEDEANDEPTKVTTEKPLPKIDPETQTLMETHKDLLKWVGVTMEQPAYEYPEQEYPTLSSKVDPKDRVQRFLNGGKSQRLTPPVLYRQPCGFNFKVKEQTSKQLTPKKSKPKRKLNKAVAQPFSHSNRSAAQPFTALQIKPTVQPLMDLQVQPPKKALNKLCFSFFKKEKCSKQACLYAHSIKEVNAHTIECRTFSKTGVCTLIEVVGQSKSKGVRFIKNLEGRTCYGRHNHGDLKESIYSYISRTTKQFDVIQIAKQMKASQESNP